MSLTRLAGARSLSAFFAYRTRPSGSTSRTASALKLGPRPATGVAGRARSVEARGQPAACDIRTTGSARVTGSHAEDGARFIHHALGDGSVAVLGGEPLDRALRHGPDEAGDPLEPRGRRGLPRHRRGLGGRWRRLRAAERGRERTRPARLAGSLHNVRPRAGPGRSQ